MKTFKEFLVTEASNLNATVNCINGKKFSISVKSFTSPETDGAGFTQEMRDLGCTALEGYASIDMWISDKETRKPSGANAPVKIDPNKFRNYYK